MRVSYAAGSFSASASTIRTNPFFTSTFASWRCIRRLLPSFNTSTSTFIVSPEKREGPKPLPSHSARGRETVDPLDRTRTAQAVPHEPLGAERDAVGLPHADQRGARRGTGIARGRGVH